MIDVQAGLFSGEQPVVDGEGLIARLNSLIARARAANLPIIFIQDDDVGPPESAEWALHPQLAATPSDHYLRKPHSDAFYKTELQALLSELGVNHVITSGCSTDACVDATTRRALALGYHVTLASDGHSTCDNEFMRGEQSIAYYNIILSGLGRFDGFGNGERSIAVVASPEIAF